MEEGGVVEEGRIVVFLKRPPHAGFQVVELDNAMQCNLECLSHQLSLLAAVSNPLPLSSWCIGVLLHEHNCRDFVKMIVGE